MVAVLGFINAAIWGFVTPIWQTPDEWAQVAYVQSVAERGKLPDRSPASKRPIVSTEQLIALNSTYSFTVVSYPSLKPLWSKSSEERWKRKVQKEKPRRNDGGGYTTIAAHPFLYYLAEAGVYKLASKGSIFTRIQLMRLFSAFLVGLTGFCAWFLLRELVGKYAWLPTTGALIVVFQPMMGFMGGSVNNDIAVTFMATLLLYMLVLVMRRGLTLWRGFVIGLVLGLGILTKGNMLALVPVVVVALGVVLYRHRKYLRRTFIGAGGILLGVGLTGILWIVVIALASGDSGSAGPAINTTQAGMGIDVGSLSSYLWNFYLPDIGIFKSMDIGFAGVKPAYTLWIERFWGDYGWVNIPMKKLYYDLVLALLIVAFMLSVAASIKERKTIRVILPELIICGLSVLTVTVLAHVLFYPGSPGQMAEQGRYLLPIVGLVGGWLAWSCLAAGRNNAPIVASAVVSIVIALNATSIVQTAIVYYT